MQRKNLDYIFIASIIFGLVLLLSVININVIKQLDFAFIDLILKFKKIPSGDSIVLIGIDDKTMGSEDNFYLQRSKIAEAVKVIDSLGARLVVLDILYSEQDKNPGLQEIRNIINKIKEDPSNVIKRDIVDIIVSLKLSKSEQKKYSDALLNASLSETQKILISVLTETERRIDFDRLFVETISDIKNLIMPIDFSLEKKSQSNLHNMPDFLLNNSVAVQCKDMSLKEATNIIFPISIFAQKSFALGHIYIDPNNVKRQDLFICYKDRAYPSLALQSYIKMKNLSTKDVFDKFSKSSKIENIIGTTNLAIYPNFTVADNMKYYSFLDVISGRVGSTIIKDKVVFLGFNSQRLSDQIKVSWQYQLPSIYIHGAILQNLISDLYLKRTVYALLIEIVFLILLTVVVFLGVLKWRVLKTISVFLIALWIVIAIYFILYHNLIVQVSCPIILFLSMYSALIIIKRFHDKEDIQKMAKDMFVTKELKIVIGAKSDIGRIRVKNEDSYCIDKTLGILAVADGVGGNIAGEIASKMAIDKMRSYIRDNYKSFNADYSLLMKDAIAFANKSVFEFSSSSKELKGMATTLTAGFITGNRLIIGHVGDTRVYLYRENTLEQLTEDHTVAVEKSMRSATTHELERLRHVLTRAIGIYQSVEIDTFELTLVKGDILLFCSDGLYTMVKENDIISHLKAYNDPELVCGALVNVANKNGGQDNITVITAYIQK